MQCKNSTGKRMNYETTLKRTREIVAKHLNFFSKNTFEVSILPGWANLVEEFFDGVEKVVGDSGGRIQVSQIKEKLGGLRIYYRVEKLTEKQREEIGLLAEKAEEAAFKTCVICGCPGKRDSSTGWISVRCKEHAGETRMFDEDYNMMVFGKHEDEMAKLLKHQ